MKVNLLMFFVGLIIAGSACEDESRTALPEPDAETVPNVISDGELFNNLAGQRSQVSSDPFMIRKVWRQDEQLYVAVQYSGGCEEHEFDVIWDPEIKPVPVDQIGLAEAQLIITHEGNGDQCEAALTDTLKIGLRDIAATSSLDQLNIRIMNGSSDQTFSAVQGFMGIPENETCEYEVVLTEVICGEGLFENKWFRFTSKQDPAYLQPVSIAALIQLTSDPPNGRYKIGVKATTWSPDPGKAICQAYPGPSIPVEIWCLELIEEGDF